VKATIPMLLLACAVACGRNDGARTTRLALNWFPEVEHGGFFAALVHGLYGERGRTVEILPGGPGVPVVPRVASGEVGFGVVNADDVVAARAAGVPVVALLAPIHRSPWCVMVHAESGIERIADLHDVTLAMRAGTPYLGWIERSVRLRERRIEVVPYGGSVAPFLSDPRYAQQAYVFSEPIIARARGADLRCLPIAETGFDPYASVLVTSTALAASDPALVRDVTRASARGWARYADEPGPTNAHILAANPELGREVLDQGAQALRPLVLDDAAHRHGVGSMSPERWATLVRQMGELDAGDGSVAALDPTTCYDIGILGVTD
jgi:NitT/TauT family transport system substrate-binding protein